MALHVKGWGRAATVCGPSFYEAYNRGDLDTVASLMAEEVEYHDMCGQLGGGGGGGGGGRWSGARGAEGVRRTVPSDLQFVVEDITQGDPRRVGLTWHVEIGEGTVFPFSRGCSFYTLDDSGRILKVAIKGALASRGQGGGGQGAAGGEARDLVEGAFKPGAGALQALAAVAPLIRRLGARADPRSLTRLPLAAAATWAFYAAYTAYIMLGTAAPGLPAWQTPPEVLQEVMNESLNFFYVNILLDQLGITLVPSVPSHPVSEGLFNAVAAWGLLFLPLMLTEQRCRKVGNTWAWWSGIMFLTNVFFIPFLALRAAPSTGPTPSLPPPPASTGGLAGREGGEGLGQGAGGEGEGEGVYPAWSKGVGGLALGVGLLSVWWALWGRPELDYFHATFTTNRVFYAFVVDAALYSVWQAWLLSAVPSASAAHKYIPFFGLVAHLLQRPSTLQPASREESDWQ
ncbi:hypothetical protein V8C86DRAFT_3126050 [Haematococcus lacustris]